MIPPKPAATELTEEERGLLSQIAFDDFSHEAFLRSAQAAKALTLSLGERKAIPEIRWRYFTDPALNVRHKSSRMQGFERNGVRGEEILVHPHFLKYLHYFIFGPQLPPDLIDRFYQLVAKEPHYPGDNRDELQAFARAAARRYPPSERSTLAEEFFKLSLECGLPEELAWRIRSAVGSAR